MGKKAKRDPEVVVVYAKWRKALLDEVGVDAREGSPETGGWSDKTCDILSKSHPSHDYYECRRVTRSLALDGLAVRA